MGLFLQGDQDAQDDHYLGQDDPYMLKMIRLGWLFERDWVYVLGHLSFATALSFQRRKRVAPFVELFLRTFVAPWCLGHYSKMRFSHGDTKTRRKCSNAGEGVLDRAFKRSSIFGRDLGRRGGILFTQHLAAFGEEGYRATASLRKSWASAMLKVRRLVSVATLF